MAVKGEPLARATSQKTLASKQGVPAVSESVGEAQRVAAAFDRIERVRNARGFRQARP
jgi:hypothetical protein